MRAAHILRERQIVLSTLKAAIAAIGSVAGRNMEILLHDLDQPEQSVMAIANGQLSGRIVGSPILAAPEQDQGFKALMQAANQPGCEPVILPDYPTVIKGRTLRSATAILRDSEGQPFASLCINIDNSGLDAALAFLTQLQPVTAAPPAVAVVEDAADMALLMTQIIDSALASSGQGRLNKQAKVEAVRLMQERGLFIVKGGVEKAAAALGVTRYTVYNYLEQLRGEPTAAPRQP